MASIGVAVATYLMTSNPVTGDVIDQETIALTLTPSSIVLGDSWTLTATVSDGTSGITITFLDGAVSAGTAVTDASGVATISLTPTIGSHTYTAQGTHP